jgi:hypothetical protein
MSGDNIWGIPMNMDPMEILNQVLLKIRSGTQPNRLVTGDSSLDEIVNSFLTYDPSERMSIDQALSML